MSRMLGLRIGVLVALAGGCGEGGLDGRASALESPLVGFYQIVSHTSDSTQCDGPGPQVVGGPAYFEIFASQFDLPAVNLHSCDDLATCTQGDEYFWAGPSGYVFFAQELPAGDDGSYARTNYSSSIRTIDDVAQPCELRENLAAVRLDEDGVHLEFRSRTLTAPGLTIDLDHLDDPARTSCTLAAAEARADQMDCVSLRTIDGVRVP